MIRIELSTLISKLNEQSKLALEQAASLCIEQRNSEITIFHCLDTLLENPLSDIRTILKSFDVSHEDLKRTLVTRYSSDKTLDTYPAFSPMLVELIQDAWLLSSTELAQDELRSGAILLAALLSPSRYLDQSLVSILAPINKETLKSQFVNLLMDSAESGCSSDTSEIFEPQTSSNAASILQKYCTNVTQLARNNELDPVLCRDDELDLMIDILCRRRKNNPIVVGDAGVGKSAMFEGLALRVVKGEVPAQLINVELLSLDLGLLQAGASVKGEFEKRLKGVINEIKHSAKPIILFIDEAHTLVGTGNQEGGSDAANILKPALARGELSTVAATTWKEYKKYFEKDPALARRFQLVKLGEPSISQSVDILRGLCTAYEEAHQVMISDDALKSAVELSARYISGRQLPDKAIDVLDTACARIAINMTTPPKRLSQLNTLCMQRANEIRMLDRSLYLGEEVEEQRLSDLEQQRLADEAEKERLEACWQNQKDIVENIIHLRSQLLNSDLSERDTNSLENIRTELSLYSKKFDDIPQNERLIHPQVDAIQIAEVIADWTGVPIDQMNSDELYKITNLTSILDAEIKGQTTAIERIHRCLLTARADLRRSGRPKGAFLLVGPSGVGKTETVVQLAQQLYGGKQFLTTINMSEYQEKHTVSRLIGSPPGYVGYGEGGILTEAIRKMPYSVVLLDEVEKAHPEVLNIFYQSFDKGELADGEGRIIDCQNIVFFLTSNLGYQTIVNYSHEPELIGDKLYPELAEFFKPALLARMEVVPYLPLSREILEQIVHGKLERLEQLFTQRYQCDVALEKRLVEEILKRATRAESGARMLEAIIEGQLLPTVSLSILNRLAERKPIEKVYLDVVDGEFVGEVV